jgi:chromosome segregation ATPase
MLLDRQEDTTDSHTYAKSLEHHMFALRQNHRKTSQLLEHTQQQLRQQEATSVTLQQQHNALQQKYDELVGEYHQLFRKFQDTSGTRRAAAGKPPSIASR